MAKQVSIILDEADRSRKGVFPTPQIWVEKSQEYLEMVFGEDWQEEYYVWDCCAGTCNLLAGLTNKYNVWASTIDQPDVDIVHQFIANNEFNLLESHVFRFDFLNDDFSKLPQELQDIINDEEKRKKLIVYMNPPYAEAGSSLAKKSKTGVSNVTMVHKKYFVSGEKFAKRELFVQFLMRIKNELSGCIIAHFSKLKVINAPYYKNFRNTFKSKLEKLFVIPADTFDNVTGRFPIGFHIWNTAVHKNLKVAKADVFDRNGKRCGKKSFFNYDNARLLNDWLRPSWVETGKGRLGYMVCNSNDFQHQNEIAIQVDKSNETSTFFKPITQDNLVDSAIYFAVRHCMEHTWLNDRDQFLYPNGGVINKEFQNNCLIYALFHHQNRICRKDGKNHWIPFTAAEVDAKDNFKSTQMSDFLKTRKRMSKKAKAVFEAGKALWKYYHDTIKSAKRAVVDASLYEIREYFKGRDKETGRMKAKATDERFNELDADLRASLKKLAAKIQPKVYEYGFLKK